MSNIEQFPLTTLGNAALAVVEQITPPKREPFAPGVYFGLDEDVYHADPALGSTDMKRLSYSPCDYWFESAHNPMREKDDPTPSQIFGSAVHKFVLEGKELFEALYAPTDFSGATKAGKDERARIAEAGKTPLKRADWNQIQMAGAMIRGNPHLSDAFSGGRSEVSVFWEADGIRKKCRFDYLKIRASVDLKSLRNSRSIDFRQACRRAIAEWRYDVQATHYNEGRQALRGLAEAGAVNGDHAHEWLRKVAAAEAWAFCFVMYQAEGAPLTYGLTLSPGNGLFDLGRATLNKAISNFKEFRDRFGFDTPWVLSEPLEELDSNDLPAWAFRD